MRKFLLILLILIFAVAIYFLICQEIPGNVINSYKDVKNAYSDYCSSLDKLEEKSKTGFSDVQEKLDENYSDNENEDKDNVIKLFNENKNKYEQALIEKNIISSTSNGEIYNFQTISEKIGKLASDNNIDLNIDVNKSQYDFVSDEDKAICDLSFEFTGRYTAIIDFLDSIENDSTLGISISDFIMEEYNKDSEKNSDKSLTEEDLKVRTSFKSYDMVFEKNSIKEE